jgi:phage terminase small subunit
MGKRGEVFSENVCYYIEDGCGSFHTSSCFIWHKQPSVYLLTEMMLGCFCLFGKDERMEKLTPKQKRFCDEYLKDLNGTQAAIRAGYSKKTANAIAAENLTKPYIAEHIKKRMEKLEKSTVADAQEVVEFLTAVMRGEKLGMRSSDQLKAAELMAKRWGILTENMRITGANVQIIDDLSDGND